VPVSALCLRCHDVIFRTSANAANRDQCTVRETGVPRAKGCSGCAMNSARYADHHAVRHGVDVDALNYNVGAPGWQGAASAMMT
jgi:hypothetical protein